MRTYVLTRIGQNISPLGTIATAQGSESMATRAVSKTVNPGSNPGSPA
jgi:hypothetical protein